jgi:hypothetical protein
MSRARLTPARPTFVLRLRAVPGRDPIKGLRALLKLALRRFGLQCLDSREEKPVQPPPSKAAP